MRVQEALFLMILLFISMCRSSPTFNQSVSASPTRQWLFDIVVPHAVNKASTLIIMTSEYYPIAGTPLININSKNPPKDLFTRIQISLTKTNKKAVFIIDDPSLDEKSTKNILDKIRKHNGVDPIFLFTNELYSILPYNTFLILGSSKPQHKIYEVCAFCNKGNDEIQIINKISPNGWETPLKISSSFKGSLYGHSLTFSCILTPLIIVPAGKDAQGKQKWAGAEYNIINLLAKFMDFKVKVVPQKHWGLIKDGIATGVLGEVAYGKADIGGGGFGINTGREKFIDYSPSTMLLKNVIITDTPPKGLNLFAYLSPFTLVTWFIISASVIICGCVLYLLEEISGAKKKRFQDCLWTVAKVILWDTTKIDIYLTPLAITILLGTILLAYFALVNVWLAVLTSFLTSEPFKWKPINTLGDIENSHVKWLVNDHTALANHFNENKEEF